MRSIALGAVLVISVPEGMTDPAAFAELNKNCQPFGMDFIYPANTQKDQPVILARILKSDISKA